MTYNVTAIEGFSVEEGSEGEKTFKPGKVRTNLDLIAKETKELSGRIENNSATIIENDKRLTDEIHSFEKIFLDL